MVTDFQNIMLMLSFGALLAALIISLIRLIKGPASSDRIISLDLVASIVMGFILLYSVLTKKGIYFDIAIIISLVSFMGTVAISIYLKEKE